MPDISMCQNHECPSCERCYRYIAIPNELVQSYSSFDPEGKEKCNYFLVVGGNKTTMRFD